MTATDVADKTLVFGDDGSTGADVAWLFVNNQQWPGWTVQIVTVEFPPVGPPLPAEQTTLHAWIPGEPRRVFAEAKFRGWEHLTAKGDPRTVLHAVPADLLVIGPRGPGLLKALHLGSTAEWLLSNSRSPLLIARHGRAVHKIVVCTDGSSHAEHAVNVLAAMPWIRGTNVTVLAVPDGRVDVSRACQLVVKMLDTVGAEVRVAAGLGDDATLLQSLGMGSVSSIIKQHLDEIEPDLVVLGTRGLTRLASLPLGSTARAIARVADCSVLLAHSGT